MIIPAPEDVAFNLFSIPIYWYGITMASAIFVAILCANYLFNKINPNLKKDTILEYAPALIISGILCARLYFCLLNATHYLSNPLEILDIREGGLSIHGAIIGGVASMIFISKKSKTPLLSIIDAISCSTILGQAIGRWGNYFNSEAYGIPVASQNWGLFIPEAKRITQYANYSLFHPTFLYESVLDLVAFFILTIIYTKLGKKYKGITFFAYLTIYSIIRFFIEQLRVDSAMNIATVPIAEIVSVLLFAIGIVGILSVLIKQKRTNV